MFEHQDNSDQMWKKMKRYFLERGLADFYEFLKTLDEGLSAQNQELSESINIVIGSKEHLEQNDEYRKELISLKVEAEQIKGFTNLLRQSFLTSLYSFMELWLMRECHLDSKRKDGGQSYKTIKGKGIEKAKTYFSRVLQNDYPFGSSQDWLWITNFQLLRDCIIHRQGSLTGFSGFEVDLTLAKFIKNEQGLSLMGTDNQEIFVEYEFCLKTLQTVHRFMVELLSL